MVWCSSYKCEEYAVNDTEDNQIDKLRQFICKKHGNDRLDDLGPDISDIPENNLSNSEDPASPLICEETLHAISSSPDHNTPTSTKNSPRRKSPNEIRNFSSVSHNFHKMIIDIFIFL